jgi:polyhydroxyalkanoate synthesis regulator phasin
MIDFIKKAMFTGIGLASITKDKVEEVAKEFVEQGNLTEKEGRKLVKDMMDYSEKSRGELEGQIEKYVEKALSKLDLARKRDIDELEGKILELQKKAEE